MAKVKVEWSDPPTADRKNNAGEFTAFVETLKTRRGSWAVLPTGDRDILQVRDLAANIKRDRNKAFRPASHFEITTRLDKLYVRYIGG